MSRIGNRIITIPEGVTVENADNVVTVKGPKGTLTQPMLKDITMNIEAKTSKQLHGTTNAMINNMLIGVSNGFTRELEINGVGYRFQLQGNKIIVSAGYSHNVEVIIPEGITVTMPDKSTNELTISGCDKQAVSEFASNIRKIRKPEPYKGKGIKFKEEHIRRKEGKKAA